MVSGKYGKSSEVALGLLFMLSIPHACRPCVRIRQCASLFPPSFRNMSSKNSLFGAKLDLVPGVQNQHVSVDKDGKNVVDLSFVEEPLGLPGLEGFGWPQLEFGERIGPDLRYEIKRKLGWGMHSSTWLAYDTRRVGILFFQQIVLNWPIKQPK